MRAFRIGRPSPALVVSFLALLIALGGTSYAAFSLPKNSVGTKQIRNNAVTSSKIKNGAVKGSKIANGAVTGSKLNLTGVTVPNATHAATADNATNATNATTATSAQAVAYAHVFSNGVLDSGHSKNVSVASHVGGANSGLFCLKVDVPVSNLTATVDAVNSAGGFGFASGVLAGQDGGFVASNCPSGDNALVGTSDNTPANHDMAFWVTFN